MSIGAEVVCGVTLTTYTITEGNITTVTYYVSNVSDFGTDLTTDTLTLDDLVRSALFMYSLL